MKKILVAEDDREINRLICEYLSEHGYDMHAVCNGLEAVKKVREQSDFILVILDLMLPFQSGDMVLHKIRKFSDVPVIVVSAKGDTRSKIDIIKAGADDYITKPFDLDELLVRIEAVLRRSELKREAAEKRSLTYKKLKLDSEAGTISVNGKNLVLTNKEFAILELMLLNPKKLFSKSNLFESVWNEPYYREDTTVKVHISNIRNKIKKLDDTEEYIETVWGMGYKLCE